MSENENTLLSKNYLLIYVILWKRRVLHFLCPFEEHDFKKAILRRVGFWVKIKHRVRIWIIFFETCQNLQKICIQKKSYGPCYSLEASFCAFPLLFQNAWLWIGNFNLPHTRNSKYHKDSDFLFKVFTMRQNLNWNVLNVSEIFTRYMKWIRIGIENCIQKITLRFTLLHGNHIFCVSFASSRGKILNQQIYDAPNLKNIFRTCQILKRKFYTASH